MRPASKQIEVDFEALRAIVDAASQRPLTPEEHAVLAGLLDTTLWLESELQKERIDAKRLYRMLFGPRSEKMEEVFPANSEGDEDREDAATRVDDSERDEDARRDDAGAEGDGGSGEDDNDGAKKKKKKKKGHGRLPSTAYRGADTVCVPHESLKPGASCPGCDKGKVYPYRPRVLIRVRGNAPLDATQYELGQLRCNLCGEIFTARPPPEADGPKYDETAAAMIALLRYGTGLPHNRLGRLQESLGIPLPPSTQWSVVSDAAPLLFPVEEELLRRAACGDLLHNDDTKMPVLSLTGKRRASEASSDDPPDRTGMFTTGIVSYVEGQRIALFITGRRHAGENLTELLRRRTGELGPPMQMCDGLARNLPTELITTVANCLAHARRHFVDVADNFPRACHHVLASLGTAFRNDKHCRDERMTPEERLAYHKEHSLPVMNELEAWCRAQFDERIIEPNSALGQAITYMLKRWDKLTLFCRKAGAPLDNNICERALKRAIVHRKNSYFYRSERGARIGDMYMSLILTAELCGADPFDYLVAMLRHPDAVASAPAEWMPWCYQAAHARLQAGAA